MFSVDGQVSGPVRHYLKQTGRRIAAFGLPDKPRIEMNGLIDQSPDEELAALVVING